MLSLEAGGADAAGDMGSITRHPAVFAEPVTAVVLRLAIGG
jgi:hypothetical protein